jgi:hypothetical protein
VGGSDLVSAVAISPEAGRFTFRARTRLEWVRRPWGATLVVAMSFEASWSMIEGPLTFVILEHFALFRTDDVHFRSGFLAETRLRIMVVCSVTRHRKWSGRMRPTTAAPIAYFML